MSPPALAIALLACLAACAECYADNVRISRRSKGSLGKSDTSAGCMYEGRWYPAGSSVRTREACLSCACAHGALSCRRRACAPLPEPPPRCHVVHQRGECCPELRCPDGVKHLEIGPSARFEDREIETPLSTGHTCVEGGTVYAAGSAMSSSTACEQCFCLGGTRRCVRPVCLPPPPGCQARPAAEACCPQRYYCDHATTKPPNERNPHDCITPEGKWAFEGERVKSAETAAECIQCFCLRGSIRCQHLSCAPTLQGCKPLVQPGQCCAHQYQCGLHKNGTLIKNPNVLRMDLFIPLKDEVRSFHSSKSTKRETTIKEVTTDKSTSAITVTKSDLITTMKNKRNTEVPLTTASKSKHDKNDLTTLDFTEQTTQTVNDVSTISESDYTTEEESTDVTTEQPEGSVKIIINGTINCTAELSSTSLLLNMSNEDDTVWIKHAVQPHIPLMDNIENQTSSPLDIITNKNYNNDFDDNETFTINVTSSLRTNTTRTTAKTTTVSSTVRPKTVPPALLGAANMSKVKKEEMDLDYAEPTLPPSLPNLKIIPFVAADAVVDDEVSSKESLDYPLLESDDKFPIYYPNKETDQSLFAMRKEDVYNPTQYPIFVSKKVEPQYPSLSEADSADVQYPSITNDVPDQMHEYTVTASMGGSAKKNHDIESKSAHLSNKFEIKTPAVNLFSPPVETEGGFVPKDIGLDEYYSAYQSTPPAANLPHLTTSMQLEPKDECVSSDGRRLSEGESVSIACSVCTCAWGELHCSPRMCNTPPGCKRRAASLSTSDLCCGELICDQYNHTTTPGPFLTTKKFALTLNESKIPLNDIKDTLKPTQETTFANATNISKSEQISNNTSNEEFDVNKESSNITKTTSTTASSVDDSATEDFDKESPPNNNHSVEYEDEDEDEGFSLGSVLQLLLSETYETTSAAPPTRRTTTTTTTTTGTPPKYYTNSPIPMNKKKPTTADSDAFVPVTHRFPIIPPKKIYPQNPVNRIDHLLLGESNAIRKTTQRPVSIFKPITYSTTRKPIITTKTTQKPLTTKLLEITSKEGFAGQSVEVRPPINNNFIPGLNLGLPKLAGCNIYGRMYRVGRIIAELSSPCQECKCTELGVQCRSLNC